MKVAILGAGAVGCVVAAALERSDAAEVVVVASEASAEVLTRDGITILGSPRFGELHVRPRTVTRLDEDVDALIVAVKAAGLAAALERVQGAVGIAIPLLNGVEHVALLRERFGAARVPSASIRVQAVRTAPGVVEHRAQFAEIQIAGSSPAARALAATLRSAGIDSAAGEHEIDLLWSKLARLAPLACSTAAWDLPLGEVRADPARRALLEASVREVAAVANAEGAHIDPDVTLAEIAALPDHATTSLREDVAAGRPSELDAIAGAVLRAGARHGLACPALTELAGRVAARAGVAPPAGGA